MVLSLNSHRIELYNNHPNMLVPIRECLKKNVLSYKSRKLTSKSLRIQDPRIPLRMVPLNTLMKLISGTSYELEGKENNTIKIGISRQNNIAIPFKFVN